MTIKPLADRVLIEAKEAETKTASGLYIPDTAKEEQKADAEAEASEREKAQAEEASDSEEK